MDIADTAHSDPKLLAKLLDSSELGRRIWRPEELEAIFRHQMTASVGFDLGGMDPAAAKRLQGLSAAEGLLLNSFRDLFAHPSPPPELLLLTKDFAKRHLDHPESPLPREIARILYLGSIAAAMLRCQRRITSLDSAAICAGLHWALSQPWLDTSTRTLFKEGLRAFDTAHLPDDERSR